MRQRTAIATIIAGGLIQNKRLFDIRNSSRKIAFFPECGTACQIRLPKLIGNLGIGWFLFDSVVPFWGLIATKHYSAYRGF